MSVLLCEEGLGLFDVMGLFSAEDAADVLFDLFDLVRKIELVI